MQGTKIIVADATRDLFLPSRPIPERRRTPERETPTWYPDLDEVRAELHAILAQMRAADVMPWDADRTELYRTIFPQMTGCLPEYTSDLLDLLHVLGRLIALESRQADLLERICAGRLRKADELRETGALAHAECEPPQKGKKKSKG